MYYFLKKKLSLANFYFYKYSNYLIFISFISLTVLATLLFSYKFALYFPDVVNHNYLQLEKIPFNHGSLIYNLLHNYSYKVQLYGIDYYLDRLPFLSLVAITIGKISLNIYFFLLIKNIFFFSLFFYICNKIKYIFNNNPYFFFLITHIIFFNFFNWQTSLNFVFEDAYLSILLPCLFLILINDKIKNQSRLVSIFLVVLLFTKLTMLYLTIVVSILFIIINKNKLIYRCLPVLVLITGMTIWGVFGYNKTGRVPFLNSMSSSNQAGLALVFNDKFKDIYPTKIIDSLEREILNQFPPFDRNNVPSFKNEWEYYDYFKEKNMKFFRENKLEILKGIEGKIKFLLFNIYNYGSTIHLNEGITEVVISHILNRIIFLISLLILIFKIIKKKIIKDDVYFITIVATSLLPLIIGWITSKHIVPIFIISYIYTLLNTYKIIYKKF
jgi:hypothetical protein